MATKAGEKERGGNAKGKHNVERIFFKKSPTNGIYCSSNSLGAEDARPRLSEITVFRF